MIRFTQNGEQRELGCDFIAGCDGSQSMSRSNIPKTSEASTRAYIPSAGSASWSKRRRLRKN